jgi:hypothetical protein
MTRKTLRTLFAAAALAAIALTFATQPSQRAMATGGPIGTGGVNGTSLDGVAIAAAE